MYDETRGIPRPPVTPPGPFVALVTPSREQISVSRQKPETRQLHVPSSRAALAIAVAVNSALAGHHVRLQVESKIPLSTASSLIKLHHRTCTQNTLGRPTAEKRKLNKQILWDNLGEKTKVKSNSHDPKLKSQGLGLSREH